MTYIIAGLAAVEALGVTFALALARAAARRPRYGPPLPDLTENPYRHAD